MSGVELEEFKHAAFKRREVLRDAERKLKGAIEGKKKACKAIAEWEEGIPPDKVYNVLWLRPRPFDCHVVQQQQNCSQAHPAVLASVYKPNISCPRPRFAIAKDLTFSLKVCEKLVCLRPPCCFAKKQFQDVLSR